MKIMKILSILTIIVGFSQCGSSKFVKEPSFNIEKAFYNYWVGGQPGVSGTKLEIHLSNSSEIIFDSLFFQNKTTKVEVNNLDNAVQLIGHFSTSKKMKRDIILDVNSTNEIENTLPNLKKFPFELKENEAVLSYKKGEKTVFFKIENIKEIEFKAFPSANKK
tara:strand:- start:11764 stop:12252 length:489 start_codon:yes stop_codon:yes gene_type:complete